MNEITQSERIASQRLLNLSRRRMTLTYESDGRPWRTCLRLPRNSLRLSLLRRGVISRGPLAIRFLLPRMGGDLLLHRAVQVDISNLLTRHPQPKRSCNWVPHTPFGSLTILRP